MTVNNLQIGMQLRNNDSGIITVDEINPKYVVFKGERGQVWNCAHRLFELMYVNGRIIPLQWYVIQVRTSFGWTNREDTLYTSLEQAKLDRDWLNDNHAVSEFRIQPCDVYGNVL